MAITRFSPWDSLIVLVWTVNLTLRFLNSQQAAAPWYTYLIWWGLCIVKIYMLYQLQFVTQTLQHLNTYYKYMKLNICKSEETTHMIKVDHLVYVTQGTQFPHNFKPFYSIMFHVNFTSCSRVRNKHASWPAKNCTSNPCFKSLWRFWRSLLIFHHFYCINFRIKHAILYLKLLVPILIKDAHIQQVVTLPLTASNVPTQTGRCAHRVQSEGIFQMASAWVSTMYVFASSLQWHSHEW